MQNTKCSFWRCANSIGLFLVLLFIVCFAWFYIRGAQDQLHMDLLELSFFGYDGMNVKSFILGALQSYLWGYIALGLWQLVGCCMKPGQTCK